MIYLAIVLAVAGAGIASLWLHQRRQRMHLRSVHGFRSSLERLATHQVAIPGPRSERRPAPSTPAAPRRPERLDPARRAVAKRNLELRRAARA